MLAPGRGALPRCACNRRGFVRLLSYLALDPGHRGGNGMRRLIIGMTGSTRAIFGVRMLEALKGSNVETHLLISKLAQRTLEHETHYTVEQVRALARVVPSPVDMGAPI